MTLTNIKTIMHKGFNPALQLKTRVVNKTSDNLAPVLVKAATEPIKLTTIGKLKNTEVVESKEIETDKNSEFSPWKMIKKSKTCYNPEDYPALGKISEKSLVKFSNPKVVKMQTLEKQNFKKEMAKNLTSSMSFRPTLYKPALKNGQDFEKTAMCKWGEKCRNKDGCLYAHTAEELKVRMCAFGGECHKDGCHFPHDEAEAAEWKQMRIAKWEKSQKLNKLPRDGYVCRSCGKEGGCEDSHWVRDCPQKKKHSAPTKGYVCRCCGQKGGEKGAHWIQQCPKSKRSPSSKLKF